jgi:hypothetical protein
MFINLIKVKEENLFARIGKMFLSEQVRILPF